MATRYNSVIVPFTKPPKSVTVKIMNSKSMLGAREEAVQNAARCTDKNASDIDLRFQRRDRLYSTARKYVVLSTGLL
jgi:hypothetical protein